MRVIVEFTADTPIHLSLNYNRAIQGMLYNLLDSNFADFLHNQGYIIKKRRFKLFTYSRLFGMFNIKGSYIVFDKNVKLLVSSPINQFIEEICNNMIKQGVVELEINKLKVDSITLKSQPAISSELLIKTLSPITVYSTLYTIEGKRKTYYYSPFEYEFASLITKNLINKCKLLNCWDKDTMHEIEIKPMGRVREIITTFKGTIVKGWVGRFRLKGEPELLRVGYECGFGSKNSSGYGMVEVLDKNA